MEGEENSKRAAKMIGLSRKHSQQSKPEQIEKYDK